MGILRNRLELIAVCAALLPWLAYILLTSMNSDTLWLGLAASRFLGGETMAEGFYDNNPPLSILIYLLPAALAKWTPLSLVAALDLYMAALTLLSLYACRFLLARFEGLTRTQRGAVLAAFAAAVTILPSISFAEREHILLLGLFPFALLQLARSGGASFSKGQIAAIAVPGAVAALIKPPFLLIPALLMLHRALRRRSPAALFGAESWCLALAALAYAGLTFALFPDYLRVILPDFTRLYIANSNPGPALAQLVDYGILFGVFLTLEAWLNPMRGAGRGLMIAFYALALACLVPFALQGKGYYYHLIPAIGFFFCGFALSAESYAAAYAGIGSRRAAGAVFLVALIGAAYAARPPLFSYPSARDYRSLPLTQALRDACAPLAPARPCRVFIMNDSMETVPQTEYYGGFTHASRFPSLWFLPPIENDLGGLPAAEQEALRQKYIAMVAEDFAVYKPDVLALIHGIRFRAAPDFDFIRYFSQSPDFARGIAGYARLHTFSFDRRAYFGGTAYDRPQPVTFDIYGLAAPAP
jgi:hypothetical protein